jgi:hypothetical protein
MIDPESIQSVASYLENPLVLQTWSDITAVSGIQNANDAIEALTWVVHGHVSLKIEDLRALSTSQFQELY